MSTITKECLQQKIAGMEAARDEIPFGLDEDDSNTLAALRIALASLEAEPVGEVVHGEFDDTGCHPDARVACIAADGQADWENFKDGTRLYAAPPSPAEIDERDAFNAWNNDENLPIAGVGAKNAAWLAWQARAKLYAPPAPVSAPDYPETLPCPVMLEPGLRFGKGVPTKTMLGALQRRAEYYAELETMTPEQRAEHEAGMKELAAMIQGANGNSQVIPGCSCRNCRPVTMTDMRFVVCPECGNKRCPHANDHRHACTVSNDPGQEGSAYPAAPQQEVK